MISMLTMDILDIEILYSEIFEAVSLRAQGRCRGLKVVLSCS